MDPTAIRVALFSGNYNYVRDGANRALNTLVGRLLERGVAVRVYAPTSATPAFAPTGDLVSVPSLPVPGRGEYRVALRLAPVLDDLAAFAPSVVHISSPDIVAHRAVSWARRRGLPVLGSVHTRFETYLEYYHLGFLEPAALAILRRLYRRCDALVAPSESYAQWLRHQRMNRDVGLWSRGIDRTMFHPGRRDLGWRRDLGIADEEVAIAFLGRVVLEKGLDMFGAALSELAARGVPHRALIIGDGPAREAFARELPGAIFTGFQAGTDLARALASADVLLNPSITETFGNVTLEAMASGLPAVAADATGSRDLIAEGVTGHLVPPRDAGAYADRLAAYCTNPALRRAHGQAALAAAQGYDWDMINDGVVDTYARLIAARAPAGAAVSGTAVSGKAV